MFAQRRDADVFYNHHLVVLVGGQGHDMLAWIFTHPGGEFGIHFSDATRGLAQSFSIRVLADALEDQTHPASKAIEIDLSELIPPFNVSHLSAHFGVRRVVAAFSISVLTFVSLVPGKQPVPRPALHATGRPLVSPPPGIA